MQITAGNISITNGTSRVIGNALTDWTQVVAGYSWFSLLGVGAIVHTISAKTAPGSSSSGFWELTLQDVFTEGTQTNASYVIHKDFTNVKNLPLFGPGDVQISQIWNRAMQIIDVVLSPSAGATTSSNTYNSLATLSAASIAGAADGTLAFVTINNSTQIRQLQLGAPVGGSTDVAVNSDATRRWRKTGGF